MLLFFWKGINILGFLQFIILDHYYREPYQRYPFLSCQPDNPTRSVPMCVRPDLSLVHFSAPSPSNFALLGSSQVMNAGNLNLNPSISAFTENGLLKIFEVHQLLWLLFTKLTFSFS
jgi:hypothetical protein